MFGHIFKNKLKMRLRQRTEVFWTLIYPLVLAIFFSMAFSNLGGAEKFRTFDIGVVDSPEYRSNTVFISALGSVSDKAATPDDRLFNVQLLSRDQADGALRDSKIKGYILFDNGPKIIVSSSGLDQTILKEFMDSYLQQSSAVTTALKLNPDAHSHLVIGDVKTFVKQAETDAGGNNTVIMYYGLISMAVMFGGFWGRREVFEIQANMSAQAARMNMTPVHKLKAFLYSMSTAFLVQIVSLIVLIAFMSLVLGVSFGSQLGPILLLCLVAGIMGVTFGAFLSALIPGSEQLRNAIMLSVSILSSVVAGMVSPNIKYIVTTAVPPLAYINPANLVSDALYSLYYYGAGSRYVLNLLLMVAFSAVFSIVVFIVTRRQKYASL